MNLDRSINQRSYWFFLLFFGLMIWAFWKTYFTQLLDQENYRMHLHGILLIIWCIMLVAQPYLISKRLTSIHRLLGKISYVVVPLLVLSTYSLLRYRFQTQGAIDYASVALVINALIVFIVLYGLAIYNKHKSVLHSRFMVCTIFPFITPVTDRIIHIYFPSSLKYFPLLNGFPNVPLFGFLLADIILIALSIWDWKSNNRLVFPLALVLLLIYHYSFNFFYQFSFWQRFSDWLMNL